jgi:hypothetical protein
MDEYFEKAAMIPEEMIITPPVKEKLLPVLGSWPELRQSMKLGPWSRNYRVCTGNGAKWELVNLRKNFDYLAQHGEKEPFLICGNDSCGRDRACTALYLRSGNLIFAAQLDLPVLKNAKREGLAHMEKVRLIGKEMEAQVHNLLAIHGAAGEGTGIPATALLAYVYSNLPDADRPGPEGKPFGLRMDGEADFTWTAQPPEIGLH